jgi:hypothetical protein
MSTEFRPFDQIPNETVYSIFLKLNPNELAKACCVCKHWEQIGKTVSLWNAFDLEKTFPSLKIIDEKIWETYVDTKKLGLSFENIVPLDMRKVMLSLNKLQNSAEVESDEGFTLLTIPAHLILEKVFQIAESPKQGNAINLDRNSLEISAKIATVSVNKPYRILICNDILPGSHRLNLEKQQKFIEGIHCRMPKALEITALLVLTYVQSKKRLLGTNVYFHDISIPVSTACLDNNGESCSIVGKFNSSGLSMSGIIPFYGVGIAAVKEL